MKVSGFTSTSGAKKDRYFLFDFHCYYCGAVRYILDSLNCIVQVSGSIQNDGDDNGGGLTF